MRFIFKCFAHEEDSPSLIVYTMKGEYYCMSCGVKGDYTTNKKVVNMIIEHLEGIIKYMKGFL